MQDGADVYRDTASVYINESCVRVVQRAAELKLFIACRHTGGISMHIIMKTLKSSNPFWDSDR